jgi:transcription-repair coupling factor (superfamily II helicase)
MSAIATLKTRINTPGRHLLSGLPQGMLAQILPEMVNAVGTRGVIQVCVDDQHLAQLEEQVRFHAPNLTIIRFPAWDCLPYDRVSPSSDIVAQRLSALAQFTALPEAKRLVLTTVNAITQRVVPKTMVLGASFRAAPGQRVSGDQLQAFLVDNGYTRTGTVVDPGDFAVRGGLIDIFPPGAVLPVRLDFFGDTLESIRSFDPHTQRTTEQLKSFQLNAANEVLLAKDAVALFRKNYAEAFSGMDTNDPLYESVTGARRYQGMEHWLPLFHSQLETLFDYLPEAVISLSHMVQESTAARHIQIEEYYDARKEALGKQNFGAAPYKPLPPQRLYILPDAWAQILADRTVAEVTPFERPESTAISFGGRQGKTFAAERAEAGGNVYDAVKAHVAALQSRNKRVIISAWSEGSSERLATILRDHDVGAIADAKTWDEVLQRDQSLINIIVQPLEEGFETPDYAVITEQDILGDRLVRRARKARKAADVIAELSSLLPGDFMVHVDHGIGRFEGLKTIEVQGAPHDCLLLIYANNDRLFIPVENIDLLSRYGSETENVQLDKLGGGAWQAKKAKLKQRILDIANDLIKTAAARELRTGEILSPPEGAFDEFCARFPYEETEDQLGAIEAVIEDMQTGRPMDRLVCGDVGFGKTEVALRAAFVAAYAGKQVAVVVPTTLLARQHYKNFTERFKGLPLRIAQASRLVGRKELDVVKKELGEGTIDIVVGTHALLTGNIKFRDLGLLIIDEEQHFGVKHKERLKELRTDVHVLTLTATPIPRTLQLALSGVREMSIIATPPIDRLAVRTYITPFDPVIIREHLLREHFRGGQSFYVVPRITDLEEIGEFLRENVPEVKFRAAHGRMAPTELEDIMTGFYDRAFDVLLSTTIVESGLDVPTANTLVVHRSDMFGLAQLYQLRGRVGRSKTRAYALMTTPPGRALNAVAERRLQVLQSLDSLGAGFTLASHDLDIRGGGNLLGEEQSGNIREVGFELYQNMLEEAVAQMRAGEMVTEGDSQWSPQINIGTSVLIPEDYVSDLQVRLGLYRRLADFTQQEEVDAFGAELHDRFGKPPSDVQHLLQIVGIKMMCRIANVQAVDAGAKGASIALRNGIFPNPSKLVEWINGQGTLAKLRPDMKLVIMRDWATPEQRLKGTRQLMQTLVKLAA